MRNLVRCRRGSAALATVIALVPLIGIVALGGEAGSWYVTKQHAQNAADAAAVAGVWNLICKKRGPGCTDTNFADYRAKEFAARNAFCNTGDSTSYGGQPCAAPPPGASQSVTVDLSVADQVGATVSQQQPAYLAKVLGLSTVNIGATAVAKIEVLTNPCILALNGSVDFQGSPTVTSPSCGVASNSAASDAFIFKGSGGISISAPMFSAGGCSQTGGNQCNDVNQHAAPVPNPFSGLDSAMASLKTSDFGGVCAGLKAYETGSCVNQGDKSLSGTLAGTYYFNTGQISIGSITGTATLILFGSATLPKITGNPTITLTAMKTPAVPPALSSVSGLMKDLLIFDSEITASNKSVTILGNASSYFNGIVYVPNSPVTYGGNSSVNTPGCFQVVAKAITFSGDTKLDNRACSSDGAVTLQVFVPRLVPS